MALAVTDFDKVTVLPKGNGKFEIAARYTGPASYASGGELLTPAKCKSIFAGVGQIDYLQVTPAFPASGGATATMVAFEPVNDGTNVGKFHFYNAMEAHTHDILIIGGQAGSTTNDIANYANTLGKQETTNATIAGATSATLGGVVATAVGTTSSQITSTTNLSSLSCWVFGQGSE